MYYLVPFDFTETSTSALNYCLKLSEVSGGKVLIIHVVEKLELIKAKEILLEEFLVEYKKNSTIEINTLVVKGDFLSEIGNQAKIHACEVVVMGTHGLMGTQKIFGSKALKVINNSLIPYVVVQEENNIKQIKSILLPFSVETRSIQIVSSAIQICKTFNAELHLIGRAQTDQILKQKINSNVLMAKKILNKYEVKNSIELLDVSIKDFEENLLKYAKEKNIDVIATTFYSDSMLPMLETFVRNLIVNKLKIPVLCITSKSMTKSGSILG